MRYNDGFLIGTGAARNVALGFVPSWVRIYDIGGTTIWEGPVAEAVAFDNNGTADADAREIVAGMRLDAADDGWSGTVKQVILASGGWDTGNAAGWIVFEAGTLEGAANLADNDEIHASDQADLKGAATGFNLTGAGLVRLGAKVSTAVAASAADGDDITPYYGSHAAEARGFTIGATISTDNDLLGYQAWAPDPGSSPVDLSKG